MLKVKVVGMHLNVLIYSMSVSGWRLHQEVEFNIFYVKGWDFNAFWGEPEAQHF